jgi:RNA polymerase sigma-70 factor (family 1)
MATENEKIYGQFKLVFDEYYVSLGNFAFSYVKDKTAAEDIVQEVFLRIWEKRQDLIGSSTIRFYLFTAVRNNCLTYIAHSKRFLSFHAAHLEDKAVIYPQDKAEGHPADRMAMIQKAIAQLPPKCKEVFLLSRIGNLSYKEIAKTLDISVKTVDNQVGKALRVLRDLLKEYKLIVFLFGIIFIQLLNIRFIGDLVKRVLY